MLDLPAMFASQLAASLTMLHACIKACPANNWESPIAKYPFWHVAYHALCFGTCIRRKATKRGFRVVALRAFTQRARPNSRRSTRAGDSYKPSCSGIPIMCARSHRSGFERKLSNRWKHRRASRGSPSIGRNCTSTTRGTCSTTSDSSRQACGEWKWPFHGRRLGVKARPPSARQPHRHSAIVSACRNPPPHPVHGVNSHSFARSRLCFTSPLLGTHPSP